MKKALLSFLIAIALCFAIPQDASAYQYSAYQTRQIDTWMGLPVYALCYIIYSVDVWNQVTEVSVTVVGPPQ